MTVGNPGSGGGGGGSSVGGDGGSLNDAIQDGGGSGTGGTSHGNGGSGSSSASDPYVNYGNIPPNEAQLYKGYLAAGGQSKNADMDLGTGYSGQDAVGCNGGDQYGGGEVCSNYYVPVTLADALSYVTISGEGCAVLFCATLTLQDGYVEVGGDFNQFWAPRTTKVIYKNGQIGYVQKSSSDYLNQFFGYGASVGFNTKLPPQQSSESISACAFDGVGGCAGGMVGSGGNFGASFGGGVGVSVMGGQSRTYKLW